MSYCAVLDKIDVNDAAPFSIYFLSVVIHCISLYVRQLLDFLFCI